MFVKLLNFFRGTCEVTIPLSGRSAVFDFLYREAIPFFDEHTDGESSTFTVHLRNARQIRHFSEENCICTEFSCVRGLPVMIGFMKKRPVLPIGLVLCALWLFLSQSIVWDIRIEGNSKTPDSAITDQLEVLGFGIGTYYPAVNFNQLHADYLAVQNDIAWLSVFMNGVVAEVQVRELWADERGMHDVNTYANIVASCAGVVREVNVFEGQAAVKPGDIVREGQVRISGVVEKNNGGIRYEYAAGEVICEVSVPLSVEVSLERESKRYTGREIRQRTVKIFKKTINFFVNGGIEYTTYDKIDMMEQVCPFGYGTLPVWLNTAVYKEYETVTENVSADLAADEAMARLSEMIKAECEGAELVSKSFGTYNENGVVGVECLLYMNRDIGKTAEFTVHLSDEADGTADGQKLH